MPNILILGASSYLGTSVFYRLKNKAIGTFFNTPIKNGIQFNLQSSSIARIPNIEQIKKAIIFFGAPKSLDRAYQMKEETALLTSRLKSILSELKKLNIKPIYISSDAVFGDNLGNHTETTKPKPVMAYGIHKLEIENFIKKNFKNFMILRPSKVYSSDPNQKSILKQWYNCLNQDKIITCAIDYKTSPIDNENLARAIVKATTKDLNGVFHAAGPVSLTYLELLDVFLTSLEVPKNYRNINPVLINQLSSEEHRPTNNSLISDKLFNILNMNRYTPEQVCKRFVKKITFPNNLGNKKF